MHSKKLKLLMRHTIQARRNHKTLVQFTEEAILQEEVRTNLTEAQKLRTRDQFLQEENGRDATKS